MGQNTASETRISYYQRTEGLNTIVVDPDDVIEVMRRDVYKKGGDTHVLRINPPISGERRANPYVSKVFSPSEQEVMVGKPMFIFYEDFIEFDGLNMIPPRSQETDQSGTHPQLAGNNSDNGKVRKSQTELHELTEGEDEYWRSKYDSWEEAVRDNLTEEIEFYEHNTPEGSISRSVPILYKGVDEYPI